MRRMLPLVPLLLLSLAIPALSGRVDATADDAKPAHKNYTETIPGPGIRFDMVAIPGGEFTMGSPDSEADRQPIEGPQHKVRIEPFWMGRCEVSWNEFRPYQMMMLEVLDKKREKPDVDGVTYPTKTYLPADYGHGYTDKPAISMSHHNAMEYCRWLSAKTGKFYRLPTEAEWEYACRAGTKTRWFFGDDPAKLGEYARFKGNSDDKEHEDGATTGKVGLKQPNPWGLYDILGNVKEWTLDQYDKGTYATRARNPLSISPVTIPNDRKWQHVARGGSFKDGPAECRSASRSPSIPKWMKHDPQEPRSIWWLTRMDTIGFRVVCPVEQQADLKGLKSKIVKESYDDIDDD